MAPLEASPSTLATISAQSYDVIIVGGGLSGLVLASRLSEVASKRILVLEAGGNHMGDPKVDTPGLMGTLWEDPEYDWGFWCQPQEHLGGRQIQQPRGKLLGGSSAVNYTAVLYPSQQDFDSWTALGNTGWSYRDMAPYFKKFHTYTPAKNETADLLRLNKYMDMSAQGQIGPLSTTHTDTYGPFNQAWMDAFDVLGFANTSDPIECAKTGAFSPPNSINSEDKKRSYSASAYYNEGVAARPNLDVVTNMLVTKALLDRSQAGVLAKGVQMQSKTGDAFEVRSTEVILCAGSFQSPQILELSGIGSASLLRNHGIDVVVDNPAVGENLQDHCFASVSFEVADDQISGDVMRDPSVVADLLNQYLKSGTGPFSGMPMSMAYLPAVDHEGVIDEAMLLSLVTEHLDQHPAAGSKGSSAQYNLLRSRTLDATQSSCQTGMLASQMHFNPGRTSMSQAMAKLLPGNYVSFTAGLHHPFSRGSVHVQSENAHDAPSIDPRYLSHPLDLELTARCVQFLERIATKSPMSALLKSTSRIPEAVDLSDLETAKKITKERLFTSFHPSGTCAMLPRELGGVVDSQTRVYGVKGLRVIDASIFPLITQGNIQATVYAVSERAADLIKEDWIGGS